MAPEPAGARGPGPADVSADLSELGLPPQLVTGEAVALDLRPASFASRALALTLDLFIQFSLLFGGLLMIGVALSALDPAAGTAASLVVFVAVLVGLPVTVESLSRGRSVGKLAAGLRVVRDDGGPVRFRQSLVRGLVAVFEIYLTTGAVALICSLTNARGCRVGDLLAGTFVIRERARSEPSTPVLMPPHLADWAHRADIGRLPDNVALAVRQFLRRAERLTPASRQRIGLDLAAAVSRYVAPAPPGGVFPDGSVQPESFLAAVLAQRRDRDLARLLAEQAAAQARMRRRATAAPLAPGGTALIAPPPDGRAGPPADIPHSHPRTR